MKRLLLAAGLALALTACGPQDVINSAGSLPPPVSVADQTIMDEQTVIAFDTSVETAAALATVAVKAGIIRGANLDRAAVLSKTGRTAVLALGAAYRAGNATSYAAALVQAKAAISGIRALAKGEV